MTSKHRVTDLTDLYVIPVPNKPGFLTLVLNVHPAVSVRAHFPERVSYNFLIRKATIKTDGKLPEVNTHSPVKIACSFETPHRSSRHRVTCKGGLGIQATSIVNSVKSTGQFKVFAGHRSDPFFFKMTILLSQ